MKKLLFVLAMVMTMAVSGLCFAADGNDLNAEQKTAQSFISVFEGQKVPSYEDFTKDFSDSLKNTVTEQAYSKLQRDVKVQMGTLTEAKFYSYQRFDQGDRVTYIASFDNANLVAIVFSFDKDLKLVNFALTPMQQQNSQAAAE